MQYNMQVEKLCNILQLGEIVSVPEAISGGLMHRMYSVETTTGKYAIKELNPQIMIRPTAMQNLINSERFAKIIAKNNKIPALPAKIFNGTSMQKIDNQFYLVFDWVDGKSLKPNEINLVHCEKIGTILADIHWTDFSEVGIINDGSDNTQLSDWNYYLQIGRENDSVWVNKLLEIIDKLYDWNAQANKSTKLLAKDQVISHRDLDPKNVLWNEDHPVLIDWEAAGFINPMQDLTETAVYWSEDEEGNVDKEKFLTIINSYKKKYGTIQINWKMVLVNGFLGKLGWLEYSIKRSLWIECTNEEEQQMGTAQVTATINAIRSYSENISLLEKWLNDEEKRTNLQS
jgi:thiamine kinase-like enzyme